MKIKSRSEADQKQIKSFPAEAGPTVEAILEGVRGAFSGTGFSREEASSSADIFADSTPSLWETCVRPAPKSRLVSSECCVYKDQDQDQDQDQRQMQINSFPAEAGPTVEAILEGVRGAFSGTGFSREDASSGADIFADSTPSLWERACSRMPYQKRQISDGCAGPS